jgi:hypothetical protein
MLDAFAPDVRTRLGVRTLDALALDIYRDSGGWAELARGQPDRGDRARRSRGRQRAPRWLSVPASARGVRRRADGSRRAVARLNTAGCRVRAAAPRSPPPAPRCGPLPALSDALRRRGPSGVPRDPRRGAGEDRGGRRPSALRGGRDGRGIGTHGDGGAAAGRRGGRRHTAERVARRRPGGSRSARRRRRPRAIVRAPGQLAQHLLRLN